MSRKSRYRTPPELLLVLSSSGLTWELEHKRKHVLLRVEGRAVLALPRGDGRSLNNTAAANAVAALRRHIRNHHPKPGDQT